MGELLEPPFRFKNKRTKTRLGMPPFSLPPTPIEVRLLLAALVGIVAARKK